jgi:hypothetical protein
MVASPKMPREIAVSSRLWFGAVALDGAAVVARIVLGATHSASYGTIGDGATANGTLLELVLAIGAIVLVVRMRAGAEWARTVLGAASVPVLAYLVLQLFGPVGAGVSTVNFLRLAVAASRVFEAIAIVAAVWSMYRPAAKKHFEAAAVADVE